MTDPKKPAKKNRFWKESNSSDILHILIIYLVLFLFGGPTPTFRITNHEPRCNPNLSVTLTVDLEKLSFDLFCSYIL